MERGKNAGYYHSLPTDSVVTLTAVTVCGVAVPQQERWNVVMSDLGMIYMTLHDTCQHNQHLSQSPEFLTDDGWTGDVDLDPAHKDGGLGGHLALDWAADR